MKKFSPPQMKEVSFPTPHTLFQVISQENDLFQFRIYLYLVWDQQRQQD